MAQDYKALRDENKVRYGTDIGRIGKRLLEDRYDKRTHFIFELLQNAEDALRRRSGWEGQRSVRFELSPNELRVSHFGAPFDSEDVIGICGIDQSTKDLTAIGRFGIGFKSVYAFTDRPEVHSGEEDFAIESYVWPHAVPSIKRDPDETVFVLPFKPDDPTAGSDVAAGLRNLGLRTLLFLREVEEIEWHFEGGRGLYLRSEPDYAGEGVRYVTILGEETGKANVEENWLIFDRAVTHNDKPVGYIEVAFKVSGDAGVTKRIEPISGASLVAFFPTVLPTHTGFLIQGPFRTTPSRDNVPVDDPWNRELVKETSKLLKKALLWMREVKLLDVSAIRALPLALDALKNHLFEPLFDAVVEAFKDEALIPTSSGGYASAAQTRLARTQDIRELFDPDQLGELLQSHQPVHWVSGDITADRTPEVRRFLNNQLDVTEYTLETLMPRLRAELLKKQTDDWISILYKTLLGVPRVLNNVRTSVPIIRLEDGTQVVAFAHGRAQAFLPGSTDTAFPTVRRSLCGTKEAQEFFRLLDITEPDPVDDVILNVLPRYDVSRPQPHSYEADIARIRRAFKTDSNAQRDKLVSALRDAHFVMVVDAHTGQSRSVKPSQAYIRTDRLVKLFEGVEGVFLVDDRYDCLRGEEIREVLEASGASRYIAPIQVSERLTFQEKSELRVQAGCKGATSEGPSEDYSLRGLDSLLALLPKLAPERAAERAGLLWDALRELLERRGQAVFRATYRWFYYSSYSATTDADFIRCLNRKSWVPTQTGSLAPPSEVDFEALGWVASPILETKVRFKPPVVEILAREAGIDPAVLNLLKQHGLTDVDALLERLKLTNEVTDANGEIGEDYPTEGGKDSAQDGSGISEESNKFQRSGQEEDEEDENEGDREQKTPTDAPGQSEGTSAGHAQSGNGANSPEGRATNSGTGRAKDSTRTAGDTKGSSPKATSKAAKKQSRFISYVATEPDEEKADPDGLTAKARNALEEKAIALILEREPTLDRTPSGNKGFDLVEYDAVGEPERWVEVKAMSGTLNDRPVGMSSAQFEFARKTGEQYWLYIVENASERKTARILKIQNPARRAGYFTFDRGWEAIAEIDGCDAPDEQL